MTPDNAMAVEPQPEGMGQFARISGVFFEPTKTFEDIAKRPAFWVPLILVIVVAMAYMFLYSQHVGWERMIRHQMETSSRAAQMAPEQREQAITAQVKFVPVFVYAAVIVGTPIYYLVSAGVLLLIVKGIMSAPVSFKQVFAVMCYAGLVGLLNAILAIVVMFLKNPDDFNLQNPLVFNPGAFMDPLTSSKFLFSLATSLDLFVIWTILLIAVGLKAAGGKALSFGGALAAVALPWAIWILGKAALAGAFS